MTNEDKKMKRRSLDDVFMGITPEPVGASEEAEEILTTEEPHRARVSLDSVFFGEEEEEILSEEAEMDSEPAEVPVFAAAEDAPLFAEETAVGGRSSRARGARARIKQHVSPETRARLEEEERQERENAPVATPVSSDEAFFAEDPWEDEDKEDTLILPMMDARETADAVREERGEPTPVVTADKEVIWDDPSIEEQQPAVKEKKESVLKSAFFGWILPIVGAIALAVFIRQFVGGATTVQGTSMEPTLHDGNVLLVSKIETYMKSFHRGDVLIIDSPDQAELYVKRLIGLPGETVSIKDGKIYVNNQYEVKENYTNTPTVTYKDDTWTLGADEYFVLGDNRGEGASNDSRLFGPIKASEIEAVAHLRIWPIGEFRGF